MKVQGDLVSMLKTKPAHFGTSSEKGAQGSFLETLKSRTGEAVKGVNAKQVEADRLMTQMVTKPDSVNIHDVMIAQQKAQLSLDLTRSVINKAIQAYKGLTSLR